MTRTVLTPIKFLADDGTMTAYAHRCSVIGRRAETDPDGAAEWLLDIERSVRASPLYRAGELAERDAKVRAEMANG